ncbi:MAG: hypothetical protein AB7S87_02980 [Burkholderiales bacterium]
MLLLGLSDRKKVNGEMTGAPVIARAASIVLRQRTVAGGYFNPEIMLDLARI